MKVILSLILIFFCVLSYGQLIKGKVIDSKTKKGLTGASVRIDNKGTITNQEGYFTFNTSSNSKLIVSHIGFSTVRQDISSLQKDVIIELEETGSDIAEVVVSSNVRSIIEKAIKNIPANFPTHTFGMKGIQREYHRLSDNDYLYLLESYLDAQIPSYTKPNEEVKIQVKQLSKKVFKNLDNTLFVRWGGTSRILKIFDFVKERKSFINENDLKKYTYKLNSLPKFEDKEIYAIDFKPKESSGVFYEGTVYIETGSYAFVGAKYHLSKEGLSKESNFLFNILNEEVEVFYQSINNKWYIRNIKLEHDIVAKPILGAKKTPSFATFEYVCSEVDTTQFTEIGYKDNTQRKDILLDSPIKYDSTFWKNYQGFLRNNNTEKFLAKKNIKQEVFDEQKRFLNWGKIYKYILYNTHYGIYVSNFPISITNNFSDLDFSLPQNNFSAKATQQNYAYSNVGIGLFTSFGLGKKIYFNMFDHDNYNLGGSRIIGSQYGLQREFKFNTTHRPFYISPSVNYSVTTISKDFGVFAMNESLANYLKFDGDKLGVCVSRMQKTVSIGTNISLELSRWKKLSFGLQYHIMISETNEVSLHEKKGFFLFRGKKIFSTEPILPINQNKWTFTIGLTLK